MHDMNRRAFLGRGSMIAAGATLGAGLNPATALARPVPANFGAIDAALQWVSEGPAAHPPSSKP